MPLRQDEEFPPLTLDQQAEALRIAARLQARHDEESAVEGMIRAAEEAGIERRFLDEAVTQVAGRRRWRVRRAPAPPLRVDATLFFVLLGILVALTAAFMAAPLLVVACLLSFLFALVPSSMGRSRRHVYGLVVAGWVIFDVLFFAVGLDVHGEFLNAALLQLSGVIVGAELARWAYRVQARLARPREGAHRPQSL